MSIQMDVQTKGFPKKIRELSLYPRALSNALQHWMYRERAMWLGTKKNNGKFRKQILRIRKKDRTGTWSKQIANAFKGVYDRKRSGSNRTHTLTMGLLSRKKSRFMRGLEMMAESYNGPRTITSAGYMITPVQRNLKKIPIAQNRSTQQKFDLLAKGKRQLSALKRNNRILFLDKNQELQRKGKSGRTYRKSALLFVGKKRIKLSTRYNFVKQWRALKPKIMKRGDRLVLTTLRGVKKGKIKGL